MFSAHRVGLIGLLSVTVLMALVPIDQREASADIDLRFWTIESEHFIIHYHEPLADVAKRVASLAERAHQTLVPAMKSVPTERTHIVLLDTTDSSNGFAQTIPRNAVTLFVTAPEGFSQLMDHDDWLYGLVAHEYAHIVHLDNTAGLPTLVNRVVGKTWAPNQVQPRWVIEGLATYEEGKRTSGGRTRYAEFAADLRVQSLAGTSHDLGQISNGSRLWPHGTIAYEYGGHFLTYVFDAYGDDKAGEMSNRYGQNPIPWSINRTFEETVGKTAAELYDEFGDFVRGEAAMTVETVERRKRREGERLTFGGETNSFPRFRRDKSGSVIWLRANGLGDANLVELPLARPGDEPTDYMSTGRILKFALSGDGSVVFSQVQVYENDYSYRDLIHYDPKTRRYEQLTERLRASEPAVAPDGKRVAFVINDKGQRSLAVSPIKAGANPRILWKAGRYDQAYEPTWSPDGTSIAFSAWRQGGYRDLHIVDVATGVTREVSHDRAQDLTPVFGPDGRYLYFTSDRSGVFNVYALELAALPEVSLWQVTNVVGGAIQPDVSPDGKWLVYQGMVSGGYDVFCMALDPKDFTRAPPYVNARPDPVIVRSGEAAITTPRRYRPIETMAPQSYEVQLQIDSFGQAASLTTDGADIIGRHRYTFATTIGLEDRNVNVAARYTYHRLWPDLSATLSRRASRRGGFIIDGANNRFTEEDIAASVAATLPIYNLPRHRGDLTLDYGIRRLRDLENPFDDFDPNEEVPDFPETDITLAGIGVRWGMGSARGFTHTLGPVTGTGLALAASLDHPVFGSDFTTLRLRYDANTYGRLPYFKHVSVLARFSGGIALSDRRRAPNFALGGVPEQDVIDSVVNSLRRSGTGYLRGFDPGAAQGAQFHLANFELRREIAMIERGLGSLPFYLRRLHVAALLDVGNAWRNDVDPTDLRMGVGGSLRLDAVFGYFVPGSFDIGYARGIGDGGKNEFWFLLTTTI